MPSPVYEPQSSLLEMQRTFSLLPCLILDFRSPLAASFSLWASPRPGHNRSGTSTSCTMATMRSINPLIATWHLLPPETSEFCFSFLFQIKPSMCRACDEIWLICKEADERPKWGKEALWVSLQPQPGGLVPTPFVSRSGNNSEFSSWL